MNLEEFIIAAIKEDVATGDHTSLACIGKEEKGKAVLLVKEAGIISGIQVARKAFDLIDDTLKFKPLLKDGDKVNPNDIAFYISGNILSILKAERLVLNIMQRMSGISTQTYTLVQKVRHTKCKILDTRKTTPNFRCFEKMAVTYGGGLNHRMGLFDMIMIKDNHIDFAGGIENAIDKTLAYLKKNNLHLKIEIEARSLEEVKKILAVGKIDRIMLDNFSAEELAEAIHIINGAFETEASGGINESSIVSYAETGVDFISVGALTHHVKSLDLSLKAAG